MHKVPQGSKQIKIPALMMQNISTILNSDKQYGAMEKNRAYKEHITYWGRGKWLLRSWILLKDMKGESWVCRYLGKEYFKGKSRHGHSEKETWLMFLKHSQEGSVARGGWRK